MQRICVWIATGFGLGYSPVASGTVGSLWGVAIAWGLASCLPLWGQCVACIAMTLACVQICTVAEKALGGKKDDGRIVADEYLTFPICVLGLPWMTTWWIMPVAFVVARFMDIVKPFPAHRLQSLKGGLGITIDDFVSTVYALGLNWVIYGMVCRVQQG